MVFWLELMRTEFPDISSSFELCRITSQRIAKELEFFSSSVQDNLIAFIVRIYAELSTIEHVEKYLHQKVLIALIAMLPSDFTESKDVLRKCLINAKNRGEAQHFVNIFYEQLTCQLGHPLNFITLSERMCYQIIEISGGQLASLESKRKTILDQLDSNQSKFPEALLGAVQQTIRREILTEEQLQKVIQEQLISPVLQLPSLFRTQTKYLLPTVPLHQVAFKIRELVYPVSEYSEKTLSHLLSFFDLYIAGRWHKPNKLAIVYEYRFRLMRVENREGFKGLAADFEEDLNECKENTGEAEIILAKIRECSEVDYKVKMVPGVQTNSLEDRKETILSMLGFWKEIFFVDLRHAILEATQKGVFTEEFLRTEIEKKLIPAVLQQSSIPHQLPTKYLLPMDRSLHEVVLKIRSLAYPASEYSEKNLKHLLAGFDSYPGRRKHAPSKLLAVVYEYHFRLMRIENIDQLKSLAKDFATDLRECNEDSDEAKQILVAIQGCYYQQQQKLGGTPL